MSYGILRQVAPCRRCGKLAGWYEKRVCKYLQFFEPDGESLDASNMERVRGGDVRYCMSCHANITDKIQRQE